ncbi:MAG: hypothetical protein MRZ79_19095 [Bacteroidia bacterium]|nr:hypothetical protein [Bacteroidia bacterium]
MKIRAILPWFLCLLAGCTFFACQPKAKAKSDPLFLEAFEIHKESVKLHKEVSALRDSANHYLALLKPLHYHWSKLSESQKQAFKSSTGKAYQEIEDSFMEKFTEFNQHERDSLFVSWMESFTEIPGIQDYTNHHEDIQHGPSLIKDLKGPQVMAYQKEYLAKIKVFHEEYSSLLDSMAILEDYLILLESF